jgi:hypothetical protein
VAAGGADAMEVDDAGVVPQSVQDLVDETAKVYVSLRWHCWKWETNGGVVNPVEEENVPFLQTGQQQSQYQVSRLSLSRSHCTPGATLSTSMYLASLRFLVA